MAKFYNNKTFKKHNYSKAVITTSNWRTSVANVFPDFDLHKIETMIDYDPIARGALNHFVAKCMEGDISFIKKDTYKYDESTEKSLMEKHNFRTDVLRKIFRQLKLWNNAFVEIVRTTDNETKAINVLNSQNVDVVTEINGDPKLFSWKIVDPVTGKYPEWNKDDIVWIKYNDESKGYATVDLQALWENLCIKSYIREYIGWLWKTGQYRVMYGFEAPQRVVDDFIAYLKNTEENFRAPLLFGGEFKTQLIRDIRENDSIVRLLDQLDYQTAVLLRVPPSELGLPDASGRGNSDAQSNSFSTDVVDMKKVAEDFVNFKLFPRINKNNTIMRFAPNDRFSEKQAWEVIQIMKSAGCTNDVCVEYLQDRGMFYAAEIFKEEEMLDSVKNPRDKDMMPSRIGNGTGEGNQKQDEVTTREDQIRKVSE